MKREFVEKLLKENGVTEDKLKELVDQVMAENGKDIETEKGKVTAKDKELETANQTIKEMKETMKKFDGKDPEKLQKDFDELNKKHDTEMKAAEEESKTLRKEFGLKEVLRSEGVSDPDYLIFKHGGVNKFTFDESDRPIGIAETIAPYKKDLAHLFAKPETKYNPSGGNGGAALNPWSKDTFNLTKQGEILKENPAQAKELMSAAGTV